MPKQKFALGLLLALLFAYAPLTTIQVVRLRNGRLGVLRYPLREDPWLHPRLQLLRRREGLDAIVASGATQFDKIVLLRRWAHRQWQASPRPFYYPAWDAVEILDLARRRRNQAFCAQYAMVFLQACRSLGLHARYVDLEHFVVSVWSDDHNRWVLMDPTNDLHYEKAGRPLDGWSLSHAAWIGDLSGIEAVGSDGARAPARAADLAPFQALSVCMMNDQLTNPAVVIENGRRRRLTLESDYRRYPLVGRERVGFENFCVAWRETETAPVGDRPVSADSDDFRQRLHQTTILLAGTDAGRGRVKLKLFSDTTPELVAFVGGPEGQAGDLSTQVVWDLKPGLNRFAARVKTAAGWLGPESSVTVYYKRPWLPRPSFRLASLL